MPAAPGPDQLGFDFGRPQSEEELETVREELRRRVVSFELDTVVQKVAWVLNQYPEARDSDVALFVTYCRVFYPDVVGSGLIHLEQVKDLPRGKTLERARRKVQNTYGMYKASPDVQRLRGTLQQEETERHAGERPVHPSLNVFADESGKTQGRLVVGSVWFVAPFDMPRLLRELEEWRTEALGGSELHFKRISASNVETYRTFVDRFVRRDPFMGFKALVWEREGIGDVPSALADMFYYVLRRGVEHEDASGRAALPRALNFVKDEESPGYDRRVLSRIREQLDVASSSVFGGRLTVGDLDAEPSGQSPFLQVADLFTSSVSRIANEDADGPKDQFARYFIEAVGGTLDGEDSDRAVVLTT